MGMLTNQELLAKAISIAARAHVNQRDKADQPYILHPIRVMMGVETLEEKIVAVLHDTVEDTDVTLEKLRLLDFPEHIIQAVDCITFRDGEEYFDYLDRVMKSKLSHRVKIQDIKDNMNLDRLPKVTEKDIKRAEKYMTGFDRLVRAL